MASYPFDEFDQVPEGFSGSRANHRRQGVHREEPRTTKKLGLWLIVATAVMALIIGAAAFFLLPRLGLSGGGNVAAPKQNDRSQAASPTPTSSSLPSSAPPSNSATPTADPSPAVEVDPNLPIAVYNATATPGLASRIADSLEQEGFAKGDTANWSGAAVPTSVVFYQEEGQRPTAEAVANKLNIAEVAQGNTSEVTGVAVVLGPDLVN